MDTYARLGTVDEFLVCILRAVKNASNMPVLNESNLIATCDHIDNLVEEARKQVALARIDASWYGCTDRQGGSY